MKYMTENPEWVSFYPKFSSGLFIDKAGYFDERPLFHTSVTQLVMLFTFPFLLIQSFWFLFLTPLLLFGWGKLYINLPIKTGIQDCDSAAWGFNYHDNKIWIYIGGGGNFEGGKKWVTFTMPWDYTWVRTSLLLRDKVSWVHETKGNRLSFYEDKWKDPNVVFIETHPFTDKHDGTVVNATILVKEREWRPLAFKWTSLFSMVRRTIDIEFDQEVGQRKGSWKGGTIGCGYDLRKGETPLECLKRMELERKF
jgi:hypothetical protein